MNACDSQYHLLRRMAVSIWAASSGGSISKGSDSLSRYRVSSSQPTRSLPQQAARSGSPCYCCRRRRSPLLPIPMVPVVLVLMIISEEESES